MSQSLPSAPSSPLALSSGFLRSLWLWLDRVGLWQHRNPIDFFEEVQCRGFWRSLWPYRLGLIGLCIGLIGLIAWLSAPVSRPWIVAAPLLLLFGLTALIGLITIPCGTLATATEWLSFWYLYCFSAPFLLILLLTSLAALSDTAFALSFLLGLPLFLAWMAVDAGALLVYLAGQKEQRKRAQFRPGGPSATHLELDRQRLLFGSRAGCAALLLLAALTLLLTDGLAGWQGALFLGAMAMGLLRLEATLLALAGFPLAWFDRNAGRWQAAYCGRNALLTPVHVFLRTWQQSQHPASRAAILLALLNQGAAGPFVRRGVARVDAAGIAEILLHLSMRPGAADGLRYLTPLLPLPLAQMAEVYARLAEEAARPIDQQMWLSALPDSSLAQPIGEARDALSILLQTRAALSSYVHSPTVAQAYVSLHRFVSNLFASTAKTGVVLDAAAWPETLLRHLRVHQQVLAQAEAMQSGGESL